MEALNKQRGKGQQKIIVERVNVESGGQAIVGNVEAGGRQAETNKGPVLETEFEALPHNPGEILNTNPEPNTEKAKVRSKRAKK